MEMDGIKYLQGSGEAELNKVVCVEENQEMLELRGIRYKLGGVRNEGVWLTSGKLGDAATERD
jgi:hypothetical protein